MSRDIILVKQLIDSYYQNPANEERIKFLEEEVVRSGELPALNRLLQVLDGAIIDSMWDSHPPTLKVSRLKKVIERLVIRIGAVAADVLEQAFRNLRDSDTKEIVLRLLEETLGTQSKILSFQEELTRYQLREQMMYCKMDGVIKWVGVLNVIQSVASQTKSEKVASVLETKLWEFTESGVYRLHSSVRDKNRLNKIFFERVEYQVNNWQTSTIPWVQILTDISELAFKERQNQLASVLNKVVQDLNQETNNL